MKFIKFLIVLFLLPVGVTGQESFDEFLAEASSLYYDSISIEQEPLYVGEVNPLVIRSRTSHPFFESRSWQDGAIEFNDAVYQKVSFLYNLEAQNLILRRMDALARGGVLVDLTNVEWFRVGTNVFRKSPFDKRERFLQVLIEGTQFDLLAYRRKSSDTSPNGIIYVQNTDYFLEYQDKLIPLRDKNDLKRLFPDYKSINLAIKNENKKLKYSKFKEVLLTEYMRVFDEKLVD